MRKYGRWLTILLATLAFFAGVSHIKAESLPAGSQTEEKEMTAAAASSASGKILVIDEKHIYPGMTGAYQNGYTPAIEKGKARLVLPLICAGTAEPDAKEITVSLAFSGESGKVFLGTNYQKKLKEEIVRVNGEDCKVYLFDTEVALKSGSAAGTYAVTVQAEYKNAEKNETQSFTMYVTIPESIPETSPENPSEPASEPSSGPGTSGTDDSKKPSASDPASSEPDPSDPSATSPDGSNPADPSADDPGASDPMASGDDLSGGDFSGDSGGTAETKPDAAPRILVDTCEISPQEYRAGDRVDIRLVLRNTSKKKTLRNIRLTFSSNTGEVLPVDAAPDRYIERMSAGGSTEEILKLTIMETAAAVSQPITLSMEYEDADGTAYTSTEVIYLTLTTETDLRLDSPVVPVSMEAMTGQEITMNLFNVGTAKVKNVMCSIEMEGIVPKGSTFVGDVEPNETKQAVIGIVVGDLTYNRPEQTEKYGTARGTITVTYEDEKGNIYTQSVDISSEIVKPEGTPDETEDVKYESQWWVSIVIGLILIQAMAGFVILQKKRHKM